MGKNIFEGAKFGDKFLTRDGNIMLFLMDNSTKTNQYYMVGKKGKTEWYDKSGAVMNHPDYGKNSIDVVSRYIDPIIQDFGDACYNRGCDDANRFEYGDHEIGNLSFEEFIYNRQD